MSRSTYESLLKELRHNNLSNFKEILETEGLPQDGNWYDYDLLMRALRLNRKRMVNCLLNKWCRVNKPHHSITEVRMNTPLHIAAGKLGWRSIIEKMLKMGARVTDVNSDDNTPMHVAFINKDSLYVIKLLVNSYENKSYVNMCNKDGLGVMHIACTIRSYDDSSIKNFLHVGTSNVLCQVSPDCNLPYAGYSALHFAVKAANHRVVQSLCEEDADLYAQDSKGSTPIHLALERRDTKMIDILFYYDSRNANYVNDFGASHFMAACIGSDLSVVEQFISVAEANSAPSVKGMLSARVKDTQDYSYAGYTPLHFACEYDRQTIAFGLIINGVHFTRTTLGLTPVDLARKNNHKHIIEMLQRHRENCESCNDLIIDDVKSEIAVEIKPIDQKKSAMSDKCIASDKAVKGNAVFGLSRDRVILFSKTCIIANFPWILQKLAMKFINFCMGPKKDCAFCQYFDCHPSKPSRVKVLTGPALFYKN